MSDFESLSIFAELNRFKATEMRVHPESRHHTKFYIMSMSRESINDIPHFYLYKHYH